MKIMLFFQLVITAIFLLSKNVDSVYAQQATAVELKGAYIINFMKFVRFEEPEKKLSTSFKACIVNNTQLFEYINKKTPPVIDKKTITIKKYSLNDDLTSCDLIYSVNISGLKLPKSKLTITDHSGGGAVEFVQVDDTLRFRINKQIATEDLISFPARVLELALSEHKVSFNELQDTRHTDLNQSNYRDSSYGIGNYFANGGIISNL